MLTRSITNHEHDQPRLAFVISLKSVATTRADVISERFVSMVMSVCVSETNIKTNKTNRMSRVKAAVISKSSDCS